MKKLVQFVILPALFLTFIATGGSLHAQSANPVSGKANVNVTFKVDMQEQTVAPEGVHLAGSFPAPYPQWDPTGLEMNQPLFGYVYTLTLSLPTGTNIEYKFLKGITWGDAEIILGNCTQNNNRYLTVPANDTVLPVKCFAKCTPCVLPDVNITLQVDMSEETISANGIHVAGTFNAWSASATPMVNQGNDIYAVTLPLGIGSYHEYKFINGDAWGSSGVAQEIVPEACGTNDGSGGYNRYITVPNEDSTLLAVCYGSCTECASTLYSDVTFQVDMINETVDPAGVHIAGEFNGWTAGATPMTDNGDGTWEVTLNLLVGNSYEYKYINGDTWGKDENVFGLCNVNNNREVTVPSDDFTLDMVCFGKCNICNPPEQDVTFSVNMSEQTVSPEGVHLAGSMQGWDTTATQLTTVGNNIYQVTLPIGEGDYHEFKYINGNTWASAEFVPGECERNGNRWMLGPSMDATLDTVCFNGCDQCVNQIYTFNLKVMLEGPFNGTDMNTDIFDEGLLPANQPYSASPWNYDGTEILTAQVGTDVVDWVYIQMRETDGDASTATIDKMIDHQAAVVLADGTIARPDGTPNILYTGNITQNLYIVIYHRNHLAVMSATPLVESTGTFTYDFSDALSKAYMDGQADLGGGMYGMIAGDSDASGTVDNSDKDVNWNNEAGSAGYFGSDLNLDSQVSNPDKNNCWVPNQGAGTQVP